MVMVETMASEEPLVAARGAAAMRPGQPPWNRHGGWLSMPIYGPGAGHSYPVAPGPGEKLTPEGGEGPAAPSASASKESQEETA